ncbi:MAG: hypothetical protein QOF71_2503 [Candidatus Eremiobacteraeota bacterium]|nr:hypothetical protein [Candidatus Eremiobacteraeota bacterium]
MATTGSSATERVLDDPHAAHLVQLYGADPAPLVRSVGRYLADGLAAGEGAVVITTGPHCDAFLAELRALGADPAAAAAAGRLVVLDAHETMARFVVDGQPDRELFEATVRPVLTAVRERCPAGVRAYGEMVGVMWEAAQYAAATRLEAFWNALLSGGAFRLFCAYPIDVCGDGFTPSDIDAVMSTHTHVVPTGAELEPALERALQDVLGTSASALRPLMDAACRPSWAALPRAEATILWLRDNVPNLTGAILTRTREYAHLA